MTGTGTGVAAERHRLAARARLLSWASLGYMAAEGAVAILAGLAAGSVALVGFGLDSAIEGFASVVIVWRFTGARVMSEAAERRSNSSCWPRTSGWSPCVRWWAVTAPR